MNSLANNFENQKKDNDFTVGQSITYKNKFSEEWYLESMLLYDYKKNKRDYLISSDKPFLSLFFENDFSVLEQSETNLNSIIGKSKLYYQKNRTLKLNFSANYKYNNNNVKREASNQKDFSVNTKRKQQLSFGELGLFYRFSRKIKINTHLKYVFNNLIVNEKRNNQYWLLPKLSVDYELNNSNNFSFSYLKTKKNSSIYYMQNGKQMLDYQTVLLAGDTFFIPIEKDDYGISMNHFNPKKNRLLSFTTKYFYTKNEIGYNTSYNVNGIEKKIIRTPEKGFNFMMYYSEKLKFIPFRLETQLFFRKATSKNVFNNSLNNVQINTYQSEINLLSKFKKSPFQTNLGVDYSFTKSSNTFDSLNYTLSLLEVSSSIYGKLKDVIWRVSGDYKAIKTTSISKDLYAVNFSFRYALKNKRAYLFFRGDNIFNIKGNQSISEKVTEGYSQVSVFEKLKGYVVIGMKYDF